MILHWRQIELHYGSDIRRYATHFETAGQTTFGLLCCRFAPGDDRLAPSQGDHSEVRLIQSDLWQAQIPEALAQWTPRNNTIVTALVINRSPCQNCTLALVSALQALHRRFPVKCDANRFILAARGAYEDAAMTVHTRQSDLRRLHEAGWELCVLQTGNALSQRGRILLEGLENMGLRGFMRLG